MKLERIQTVQRLPIQIEEAWDFFTSPKNLRLITPHWLDYQLTMDPPEYMHPGTIISASIRPFPIYSTSWVSEITHIRPPQFYITEQRVGPFKMWHHEHHFRPHEDGVEIEDIILYGMHFGRIGSLVHNVMLRKKLHEAFSFRAQALEQRFGSVKKRPQEKAAVQIPDIFQTQETPPQQAPAAHPLQQKAEQQKIQQQRLAQQQRVQQQRAQKQRAQQQKVQQQRSQQQKAAQQTDPKTAQQQPQNPNQQKGKPNTQANPEKTGKPIPKQVTLDDIFRGTED